jgi:hypothetical protein
MAHHADGLFLFAESKFGLGLEWLKLCRFTNNRINLLNLCLREFFEASVDRLVLNDLIQTSRLDFIAKRLDRVEDGACVLWQNFSLLGAAY